MFRKNINWNICCLFFIFPALMLGQELTLEDCIEIALKKNPSLHRNELQYKRARIEKQEAWHNLLPGIEGGIGHSWNQGKSIDPTTNQFIEQTISSGNASLSTGMYIFNGFKAFHDIRKKAAVEMSVQLEYDAEKEKLILDVIEAYITVLTTDDLLLQAKKQFVLTEEQFVLTENLHEEGNIDPGDYYDIKGEYNENKNAVLIAKQNLYHSRTRLANLLSLSEEELPQLQNFPILIDNITTTPSEIFEAAKQRSSFALWDWKIEEAKQNIKVARSAYYPSLSVSAGMNTRYSNSNELNFWEQNKNNLGKYVSLNLHLPIFNGFQIRNSIKKAKIDLEDIQWQKEISENNLRESTFKAVFDLKTAQESLENIQEQEVNYRESYRIAQVKFELGTSNSVVYLSAKNKWEDSKNQLVIKQYEWVLQKFINNYYLGILNF